MTDILMPRLSDSMEEGTLLTWLIDDGGEVAAGQELAEIETDKATMTYESEAAGVVSIVAAAGTTVAVGELIARVGDGAPAATDATPEPAAAPREPVPAATPVPGSVVAHPNGSADTDGRQAVAATPTGGGASGGVPPTGATPMARRIAAVHGVALDELRGTGPRGRVVRADVMAAAGMQPSPADPGPPAPAPAADGDERVEPSRLQALVARRMSEAKATVPHFQVQTEVEMSAALHFRAELKRLAESTPAVPSLNDLIVKACALCLRRFPRANGSYVDGGFRLHGRVNVGIAVASEDALVVPVIHDADSRSLGQIAASSRALAEAVRDSSVTAAQLSGATFTVSNLGMFGMTAITPVVNPPQAAILGVGAIRDVLARHDGEIVDRSLLTLTLSCDHRILYGADAARFLDAVRALLESPLSLAL